MLLLATPVYVLTARNYLRIDLWFDEILSLNDFILAPLSTTVTDYRYPNNHVFFSLVTNLALRLLHVHTLFALMDRPWLVRSVMLVISTAALLALYTLGKRFFGRRAAVIAAIASGIALSLLLYLPMLGRVLHNPTITPSADYNPNILLQVMPNFLGHLLSGRTALFLSVPVGTAPLVFEARRSGDAAALRR